MGDKNQRGASFLDLLLVGGLIGVLSTMAIIQMRSSVDHYELISQAEQIAAELHVARTLAVARGMVVQVAIDQQGNSLAVFDTSDLENPIRYVRVLQDGISFSSVPSDPITFSSRGLATAGTITLTGASGSISIQVDASGKASVGPMEAPERHGKLEPR